MKIYISTGLSKKIETTKLIKKLSYNKINDLELSGGLYEKNIIKKLKKIRNVNLLFHNYFPVPQKPFIINLASTDMKIYKKSFDHLKKAIFNTSKLKLKYFSFHAGFLIDPNINDFGKTLSKQLINDRNEILNLFIKRLNYLSNYAKKKGVILLIENNVITKKNLNRFGKNPFLMTRLNETKKIMMNTNSNVKLLIDVAHLKVSAKTLKFDPINYLSKLENWIEAYHLSDNNGQIDSNKNLTSKSWFWKYLKADVKYCTLELKDLSLYNIKSQLILCKNKIKNNIN